MILQKDKIALILSASQRRFGTYGLSKTTMNEIADDVGMSKASLYYYFKDKESIFLAVSTKEQNDFAEKMRRTIAAESTASKMLSDYTIHRLKLLQKLLTISKFSNDSYPTVKPLIRSLTAAFKKTELGIVLEIIRKGKENKEFEVSDPVANAELFIDVLRGLRQAKLAGLIESGQFAIPAKEYNALKKQSELFTKIFIEGLCKS